jgi:2-methylcitrate dehydratase
MGHHGELIAPVLAVGERQHSNGQEVITNIVLAYELSNRLFDSLGGRTHGILAKRGWTTETVGPPCIMALLAGRLLGLGEVEMANALGIAGCFNIEPGILFTPRMTKNLRTPYGAYGGIFAAFLAQKGFTGPLDVFEGPRGIAQVVAGGEMDLEKLRQPRKEWTILYTWIKNFAADGNMQGLLEATITLAKEHDIRPEDVAHIKIRTMSHIYRRELDSPERQYPNNKYTADHSCRYVVAVAILDRAVGPEQFSEEKLRDPRVRDLIGKITVEPDAELDGFHSPGIAEIRTRQGADYSCRVVHPKGHPMNPMAEDDVEEKFRRLAGKLMSGVQMSRIVDAVYDLEKVDDIGRLLELLVIPGQAS